MAHPSKPSAGQTGWDVSLNSALDVAYDRAAAYAVPLPSSPAKGTMLVYDGSAWTKITVGSNGQVITADSTQTLGVKWATPSGGAGGSGGAQFNVQHSSYGAVGDGSTDDTSAIQAAVDAAAAVRGDGTQGGVVYFPAGTYKVTSPIVIGDSGVSLAGDGVRSTVVYSTSTTTDCFQFTAPAETNALLSSGITVSHMTIQGPTLETSHTTLPVAGTGSGINFVGNSLVGLELRNIEVKGFRGTGIHIGGSIVTVLEMVRSETNGVHGIHITGVDAGAAEFTSTNILGGWSRNNMQYGLFIDQDTAANYSAVIGFASDDNAYNYRIKNSRAVTFIACGSEFHGDARLKSPETSFYVDGSHQISFINCLSLGSNSIDFQFVNSCANFNIDAPRISENTPRASKTATVNAAAGCTGFIRGVSDVSSVTTMTLPSNGVIVQSVGATNGYTLSNAQLNLEDNLRVATAGKGLKYAAAAGGSGGAHLIGETTLVAGTKTVSCTGIAAGAHVFLQRHSINGGPVAGFLTVSGITAGVGFTINSYTSAGAAATTDVSTVYYHVVNIG